MYSKLERCYDLRQCERILVQQRKEGRLSERSIKEVINFWGSKNRPQVTEVPV
jgi:hypothetical protein